MRQNASAQPHTMFRWLIRFVAITVASKLVNKYIGARGTATPPRHR
jgi:hypothetical protein